MAIRTPRQTAGSLHGYGGLNETAHPGNSFAESASGAAIVVVDFDKDELKRSSVAADDVGRFLAKTRPEWAAARWIIVNTLDPVVVNVVASIYDIHPLAVEAIMHVPRRPNMDQYRSGIFATVPLCSLRFGTQQRRGRMLSSIGHSPNLPPPEDTTPLLHETDSEANVGMVVDEQSYYEHRMKSQTRDRKRQVAVNMEQVGFYLTSSSSSSSTLVTFFQHSQTANMLTAPVLRRLQSPDALIRQELDLALLMQAVLDTTIDQTFPILAAYQSRLSVLEDELLFKPRANSTIALHRLNVEMFTLKKTVSPIVAVLRDLREQDPIHTPPLITSFAGPYIGDVLDNVTSICEDLDDLGRQTDSLISLVFNLVAEGTSQSSYNLTVITMIFLPATFLCGVYGAAFDEFPELHDPEGIWLLWRQVILLTCFTLFLFIAPVLWRHAKRALEQHTDDKARRYRR